MSRRARLWLVGVGALATLVVLVPPLSTLARRYEVLAAVQFGVLAIVVPAVITVGAPWWLLKLAASPDPPVPTDPDHPDSSPVPPRAVDRLADARRRHPELVRAFGFVGLDILAIVLWRTPAAGDALQRHPWLALVEALVLVPLGVGLWLECLESPPLEPRSSRPWRAALAAIAMWSVWVVAYLIAMSHKWYVAFDHSATSLSGSADKQLSTVVLWFIAAACFMPVVFANVLLWLRSEEEDPDTEFHQLLREEHRRAVPAPPAAEPTALRPPTTDPDGRPADG